MNNSTTEPLCVGETAFLKHVFSDSQWEILEELVSELSREPELLEVISKGQGALKKSNFSLYLYRFISRQNGISSINNSKYTQILLELIAQSNLMEQMSMLAQRDVQILRMQLNIMHEGGFVDCHVDSDSDPAYISSALIQVGSQYSGGDFIIYGEDGEPEAIHRVNRSIMVMSSHSPHKVEAIKKGCRYTICLFCG